MASQIKTVLDGAARLFEKHPERANHTVRVEGALVGPTEVRFDIGGHRVTFDEAAYLGGNDQGPNPVAMTLASLAACEAIIYRFYSERLEIPFDTLSVDAEGDLDLRGGLNQDEIPAGFQEIRLTVHVSGAESAERYQVLHETVAANCPVVDSIRTPVRVVSTLQIDD